MNPAGVLRPAPAHRALEIYRLHAAAAAALDRRHGFGPWSRISFAATLRRVIFKDIVHVFDIGGRIVGACSLTPGKIDFYDPAWFSPEMNPALYLRSMSVHPDWQGQGIGRAMMAAAESLARQRGYKSLRLDAYQGRGGAGGFYLKCGFSQVYAGVFRGAALDIFEKRL